MKQYWHFKVLSCVSLLHAHQLQFLSFFLTRHMFILKKVFFRVFRTCFHFLHGLNLVELTFWISLPLQVWMFEKHFSGFSFKLWSYICITYRLKHPLARWIFKNIFILTLFFCSKILIKYLLYTLVPSLSMPTGMYGYPCMWIYTIYPDVWVYHIHGYIYTCLSICIKHVPVTGLSAL